MTTQEMRELDAWISVNLFQSREIVWIECWAEQGSPNEPFANPGCERVPHYTTDQAAAMQVLEECLPAIPLTVEIGVVHFGTTPQYFINRIDGEACDRILADTLPLAIALFAKELFK